MTARGVSQWAIARVDALDGPPLSTVLTYRRDQPWEVALRLLTEQNDGDGCTWLIGRELLAGGLHGPIGIGDVRVAPAGPQHLRVELHNGDASSALHLRYTLVAAFLQATRRLVPFGAESRFLDLDSLCDALRRAA